MLYGLATVKSLISTYGRFIKFVDGEDHVTDAEITLHDVDFSDSENEETSALLTDDENSVNDKGSNGAAAGEPADPLISDDDST